MADFIVNVFLIFYGAIAFIFIANGFLGILASIFNREDKK